MANKYANLVGTNKIKDEYSKINTGFDKVEADINYANSRITAVDNRVDRIITTPIDGRTAAQEVVDARVSAVKSKTFATLDARFEETEQDIATHMVEYTNLIKKTTHRHMVDVSTISTGNASTFTVGFLPKKITALSSIAGGSSYSHSIQYALEKGILISAYQSNAKNTSFDQYMSLVYVFTDANNGISGRITSFTEDGFVVTWEKTGSISGTLVIEMLAEGV